MSNRVFLTLGAWAALLGVVAGAFGAHALRGRLDVDLIALYQTAALYHFLHALALLVLGALTVQPNWQVPFCRAGWLLLSGLVVFSGSLYALALLRWRWLGTVTPVGGVLLVLGWLQLALAARSTRTD